MTETIFIPAGAGRITTCGKCGDRVADYQGQRVAHFFGRPFESRDTGRGGREHGQRYEIHICGG